MKPVLRLIFVLLYVASACAASQIRTIELIQKLASPRIEKPTSDGAPPNHIDNLARYREAKAPNEIQCLSTGRLI